MKEGRRRGLGRYLLDVLITLALWCYFIVGWLIGFAPLFLTALVTARNREAAFQRLLHLFCRSFFRVMRWLIPQTRIVVPDSVDAIRSSVVISNHLSYLDPMLLIAAFAAHKTIVKNSIFRLPIFGWILKIAGYLPASFEGGFSEYLVQQSDRLTTFFNAGGNIFVFPEGTRARNGRIGAFKKGAFKIANRCNVPVQVLKISNTQHLFRPDAFLFNTAGPHRIEVVHCGEIPPARSSRPSDIAAQMNRARQLIENR